MTISAYQGVGSHRAVMVDSPRRRARALFVLAATSNPEAAAIQRAVLQQSSRAGSTVAQAIIAGRHRLEPGPSGCRDARTRLGRRRDRRDRRPAARRHRHRRRRAAARPAGARARLRPPGRGARRHPRCGSARYAAGVIVSESRSLLGGGTRRNRRRDRASRRRVRSRDCLRRWPRPRPPLLAARGRSRRRIPCRRRRPTRPRRREGRRRERRTRSPLDVLRDGVRGARRRRGAPARAPSSSPRIPAIGVTKIAPHHGGARHLAASKRLGGLGRQQRRRLREFLADWVGRPRRHRRPPRRARRSDRGRQGHGRRVHPRELPRRAAVGLGDDARAAARRGRGRAATTSSTTPSSTA